MSTSIAMESDYRASQPFHGDCVTLKGGVSSLNLNHSAAMSDTDV